MYGTATYFFCVCVSVFVCLFVYIYIIISYVIYLIFFLCPPFSSVLSWPLCTHERLNHNLVHVDVEGGKWIICVCILWGWYLFLLYFIYLLIICLFCLFTFFCIFFLVFFVFLYLFFFSFPLFLSYIKLYCCSFSCNWFSFRRFFMLSRCYVLIFPRTKDPRIIRVVSAPKGGWSVYLVLFRCFIYELLFSVFSLI